MALAVEQLLPGRDDLVERDFTAECLDETWLTDITEYWTGEGKLYLCAIKDVCSTVNISRTTLYRHLAASREPTEAATGD